MEALGAVGSVVGIISLGIQIAQILQAQINTVRDADAKLLQLVWEVQATASALSNLQDLLLEDKDSDNRIFNDGGHHDINCIIRRCDYVFRNITALIAKTGKAALAKVDEFQRQIQNDTEQRNSITAAKLTIELSSLERLLWPWKLPKIEQSIADLDRLKASLILMLSVAMLAKEKKRRLKRTEKRDSISSASSQTVFEGEEEAALVDELFYKNLEYNEAEQKCDRILRADTPFPSAVDAPVKDDLAALQLIQRWPALVNANDVPSVSDLLKLNIVLEAYSIEFDDRQGHWVRVPLTLTAIREKVIEAHKQSTSTLIDTFSQLPMYQQQALTSLLDLIRSHDRGQKYQYNHASPTLLTLITPARKARRSRRFVSKLICLPCLPVSAQIKPNLFLIVGLFNGNIVANSSTKPFDPQGLTDANASPNLNRTPTYYADALNYPYVQGLYDPATYNGVPYAPYPPVPYGGVPYSGASYERQPYVAYNAELHHASPHATNPRDNGGTIHTIPTAQPSYASQPPVPLSQEMVTSTPGIQSGTRAIEPESIRGGYSQNAICLPVYPPPVSSSWTGRPLDLPSQNPQQLQLMRPNQIRGQPMSSIFGPEFIPLPASSMSFSKEEKASIACYYLEKWTTVFDHLTDDVRRRMRQTLAQRRLNNGYQGLGFPYSTEENNHGNLGPEFLQNNRLMPPQVDDKELSMSLSNPDDRRSTRPSHASQARAAVHQSIPVTRDLPPARLMPPRVPPTPAPQMSSYQRVALPSRSRRPTSYHAATMPFSTFGDNGARGSSIVPTMVPEAVKKQDIPKHYVPAATRSRSSSVAPDPSPRPRLSRSKMYLPLSNTGTSQRASTSGRQKKKTQTHFEEYAYEPDESNLPSTSRIPVTIADSPNTSRPGGVDRQEGKSRRTSVTDAMEERLRGNKFISAYREEESKVITERDPAENAVLRSRGKDTQAYSDEIEPLSIESRSGSRYEKPSVVEEGEEG